MEDDEIRLHAPVLSQLPDPLPDGLVDDLPDHLPDPLPDGWVDILPDHFPDLLPSPLRLPTQQDMEAQFTALKKDPLLLLSNGKRGKNMYHFWTTEATLKFVQLRFCERWEPIDKTGMSMSKLKVAFILIELN